MFAVPILSREMHIAGRRKRTFTLRAFYVIGLSLFMWIAIASHSLQFSYDNSALGKSLFSTFTFLSFSCVSLLGPALAASLVCEEKQRNTLGLLFLTDMSSSEIIAGKFLSAFFSVELLVLSVLPLLCVASIFGGVSLEQIIIVFCITSATALLACSVGIYFSTTSNKTYAAVIKSYVLFSIFSAITFCLYWIINRMVAADLATYFSPFASLAWQIDNFGQPSYNWVGSIVTCVLLSVILLRWSAHLLPRKALPNGAKTLPKARRKPAFSQPEDKSDLRFGARKAHSNAATRPERRRKLEGNPVLWRELNKSPFGSTSRRAKPMTTTLIVGVVMVTLCMCPIGQLLAYILLAVLFARVVAQEKEERSLEILLTTPLSNKEIVNGKLLGLMKNKTGLILAIVLIVAQFQLPFILMLSTRVEASFLPFGILGLVRLLGNVSFVVLLSLFFSTVCKTTARAVASSIVAVLLCVVFCQLPFLMVFGYRRAGVWEMLFSVPVSLLPMLISVALYFILITNFRKLALRA